MTWGDKLIKISSRALNELAAREFNPEKVYAACEERAGLGHTWLEIRPSVAANVQDCEAVKALVASLAKEKVRLEWVPVVEGADTKYAALRIDWSKRG